MLKCSWCYYLSEMLERNGESETRMKANQLEYNRIVCVCVWLEQKLRLIAEAELSCCCALCTMPRLELSTSKWELLLLLRHPLYYIEERERQRVRVKSNEMVE